MKKVMTKFESKQLAYEYSQHTIGQNRITLQSLIGLIRDWISDSDTQSDSDIRRYLTQAQYLSKRLVTDPRSTEKEKEIAEFAEGLISQGRDWQSARGMSRT